MTNRIEITVELTDEFIADALDAAGYGIAYWAEDMSEPEADGAGNMGVRITPDAEAREHYPYGAKWVSFGSLAHALAKVARGDIARSDLTEHARRAILESDAGEVDSELGDVMVQVAMFGEIVFG